MKAKHLLRKMKCVNLNTNLPGEIQTEISSHSVHFCLCKILLLLIKVAFFKSNFTARFIIANTNALV